MEMPVCVFMMPCIFMEKPVLFMEVPCIFLLCFLCFLDRRHRWLFNKKQLQNHKNHDFWRHIPKVILIFYDF